jgi:hypothetical protein
VPLFDDYEKARARHVDELGQISRREGHEWTWPLGYYLHGWDDDGARREATTFTTWDADGEPVEVVVRDEDHLQALLIQDKTSEVPDPAGYMPAFDVPPDELGWCLYETVSEGTPVTPVFVTAEELVEHLATVGEDYDQEPYRRAAAERLVGDGSSVGSFVTLDGGAQVLDGARDADRIAEAVGRS